MSSRTTASGTGASSAKSMMPAGQQQTSLPHEKIAMRAYQKWLQRGCPCGTDKQDWQEAEMELKAEMARTGTMPGSAGASMNATPASAAPGKATATPPKSQRR